MKTEKLAFEMQQGWILVDAQCSVLWYLHKTDELNLERLQSFSASFLFSFFCFTFFVHVFAKQYFTAKQLTNDRWTELTKKVNFPPRNEKIPSPPVFYIFLHKCESIILEKVNIFRIVNFFFNQCIHMSAFKFLITFKYLKLFFHFVVLYYFFERYWKFNSFYL